MSRGYEDHFYYPTGYGANEQQNFYDAEQDSYQRPSYGDRVYQRGQSTYQKLYARRAENDATQLTAIPRAPITPNIRRRVDWNLRDVSLRHLPLRVVPERQYPFHYTAAAGRRLRTTGTTETAENGKTRGPNVWKKPPKKSGEDWEREIAEHETRRIRGHGLEQERKTTTAEEEALRVRGHGLEQPMVKRRQTWGFKEVEHKM